ncbi:MAG TPA: non-canonical purine NTP pyrophosphatase [Candidatus Limnocylindria bacterium]|nr:non-canonical purine NTP pyrophosphatase [Candidatus Limnocylindria bacterium]
MKTILFATDNDRKIGEAKAACRDFGIDIRQIKLEIDEIQSHDPLKISLHKASRAFELAEKPVVITDTSWNIPALSGFPGGYMKEVADWFTPEDFLTLLAGKQDRRVSFTETIVYKDSRQTKTFSKEFWGEFADKPRGSGLSIEQVAVFDGKTIGEKRGQGKFSHEPKEYVWYDFAKWFSANH